MKKAIPAVFVFIFATAFAIQQQPAGLKAAIARGKTVYENACLACHQQDGSGVPNMNPPLAKTKWVLGDKKALTKIVLKGLQGPMEVNGHKFEGQVPMTPFEGLLNDEEVAAVLSYVRGSFGNKASPVSPEKVKAVREKIKDKEGFYHADELTKAR